MINSFYKIILFFSLVFLSFNNLFSQDFFGQTTFSDGEKAQVMITDANNNLYVGIWGKGIQKSTNGGSNFTFVNTGLTNLLIKDITITKNGVILAATFGGGVFKSQNGGTLWTPINTGLTTMLITTIKEYPNGYLLVGTYGYGIFISKDGGSTWSASNSGLFYKSIESIDYTLNGYILVSTFGGGFFQSRDTTKTWKKSNAGLGSMFISNLTRNVAGHNYAATNGRSVYASPNDGISWGKAEEDSTLLDKNVTCLAISQSNEIMVGTRNGGVQYYDKDVWRMWKSPFNPLIGVTTMTKSSNNRIYVAGSLPELYVSTNNGRNYTQAAAIRKQATSFVSSPKPSHVFGQYDGKTMYYSSDYGKTWIQTDLPSTKVNTVISTNIGSFVLGAGNGLYTSPNGVNWTKHSRFNDTTVSSIDYLNGFMIVSTHYQYMPPPPPPEPPPAPVVKMHISIDNGTNFTEKTFPSFKKMCNKIKISLSGTIYSLIEDSLFKSTDNSTTWTRMTISGFSGLILKDLDLNSSNFIYLATNKGILRSQDNGSSWIYNKLTYLDIDTLSSAQILSTPGGKLFALAYFNRDIFPAYGIWTSSDSGNSWDSVNSSVTSDEFIKLATDPDDNIYMASHGIFKSLNPNKMLSPMTISPSNNSKGLMLSPMFNWNLAEKADLYELQISDDPSFFIIHEWIVQADTFHLIQKPLEYNKEYYWRVRSKTHGSYSPWSTTASLSTMLNAPELISPANNSTGISSKPIYLWRSVPNTKVYEIQVATDNLFTKLVFNADSLKDSSIISTDLLQDKTYYWHVRAKNDNSTSPWSVTWTFKTTFGPPDLVFPPNDTLNIDIDPKLLWGKVENATYYKVKFSENEDMSSVQPIQVNNSINHPLQDLKYDTKYYWQVLTGSKDGESEYSSAWHFTTKVSPVLLNSPANSSLNQSITPELVWNKNGNFSQYQVIVSKTQDFSVIVVDTLVNGYQKLVLSKLEGYISYFWKVRVKTSSKIGYWSDVWSFTTVVANPFLRFPDNHAKNVPSTVSFLWFASQGANYYFLQISRDPDFNDLIYSKDSIQATTHEVEGLLFKTKYYWRVRASNVDGFSQWSEVWDFETSDIVPIQVSPKNDEILQGPPVILKWRPINGALTYFLQISKNDSFTELEVSNEGLTDTSFAFLDFSPKVKYFWRVKARFSGVETDWSTIWNFTVNDLSIKEILIDNSILNVFPNPSNDKSKITCNITFDGNYKLSIINLFGNEVLSVYQGFLKVGNHYFDLDTKKLPNGSYMLIMSNGRTAYYHKLVIIR